MTEQLFGADGIYGPDIRARVEHRSSLDVFEARGGTLPRKRPAPRVTEIHAGSVIEGNGWKITVGHAQHVQPYLECLAFRIDTKEGSICYTGDSGPSDAIVELAKGCDILIHMNHYFSGTEPTPGLPRGLRQPPRQRDHREARRREDAGADAPARADRSAGHPRADRPRDPAGLRGTSDLGRGPDAPHALRVARVDDRTAAGLSAPQRRLDTYRIPRARGRARRRSLADTKRHAVRSRSRSASGCTRDSLTSTHA